MQQRKLKGLGLYSERKTVDGKCCEEKPGIWAQGTYSAKESTHFLATSMACAKALGQEGAIARDQRGSEGAAVDEQRGDIS